MHYGHTKLMNYGHSEFGYVAHPLIRDSETLSVYYLQWPTKVQKECTADADRNFKRPSGPRLPTTLLRATSLMLRPSLGAACLAWAIRAAGAPPRRAPGH
jgi:hypothetical protein